MPAWSRSPRRKPGFDMAGASGKPVVQKLGIKPGFRIFAAGLRAAYDDVVVRETALARGLAEVKVCAIDEVWSVLKFVIPKVRCVLRDRSASLRDGAPRRHREWPMSATCALVPKPVLRSTSQA